MPDNSNSDGAGTGKVGADKAEGPLIAVYGIYKNEGKFIGRFLDSVKNADEILLCDTGSTDDTNWVIHGFKEQNPRVNLKIFQICVSPWRFDNARNTALSLVSRDMDICISLDMDEYLTEGWKEHLIRHWKPEYTRYYHKFRTCWPDGQVSEHWHERIHSRKGYTWKLPVHEILEYNGEERIMRLPAFWMEQKPDAGKSRSSYLPLLEQSVKERKDIWKSWSFLAGEYLHAGWYEEALKAVDAGMEIEGSDKAYLYKMKFWIYNAQKDIGPSLASLDNVIFHMPYRREAYFDKAAYLHRLGRNAEAAPVIKKAEEITGRIIDYHYNAAAWDEMFESLKEKILELAEKEDRV